MRALFCADHKRTDAHSCFLVMPEAMSWQGGKRYKPAKLFPINVLATERPTLGSSPGSKPSVLILAAPTDLARC